MVSRDCIAEGKACTPQGGCTATVIDEFTPNETLQTDDGPGAVNYVDVFSDRRLLYLGTYIDLSDDAKLYWEVAEWQAQAWKRVASVETTVNFNALRVEQDLNCLLEAGKHYRFSVTGRTPTVRFEYTLKPQPPISIGAQVYPDAEPRTYAMTIRTTLP